MSRYILSIVAVTLAVAAYANATADEGRGTSGALPQWNSTKVAYQPSPGPHAAAPAAKLAGKEWVLTAAPTESAAEQQALYAPIAAHLSEVLGNKVVFRPAVNWLVYSKDMAAGRYDLAFDDPHLGAWREQRLGHTPLLRTSAAVNFSLVVAQDSNIRSAAELVGRTVCALPEPSLATMHLMQQFKNPARQPYVLEQANWNAIAQAFRDGKCVAAMLPGAYLGGLKAARVLYRAAEFPGMTLSAGPRIEAAMQMKIAQALVRDGAGLKATQGLRERLQLGEFTFANAQDYAGLSAMLKNSLYYR